MSHKENIVRDRTLVLRVLVPGLHTSLRDKINAKKDGEESKKLSTSASSASASASSASGGNGNRSSAESILNLDGVTCMPSTSGSTLWHFRLVFCLLILWR